MTTADPGGRKPAKVRSTRGPLPPPLVEKPFPEPSRLGSSLVYLAQADCVYCGSDLTPDPAAAHLKDDGRVWRLCGDCGTTYYSKPTDEADMRTRELLTYRPEARTASEAEADRRRAYLLANLSQRLNALVDATDAQRGYGFQDAMNKLFRIEGFAWEPAYRRAEAQVDGAAELDGWYYLVETRWRRRAATWRDLDALRSTVRRSSRQTMGLFVSMTGWTSSAADTLRAGGEQAVLLMGRDDVAAVLDGRRRLADLLRAKARHLALFGAPYLAPK